MKNQVKEFAYSLVKDNEDANDTDALVSWLGLVRKEGETDEDLMARYKDEKRKLGMMV